MDSIINQKNNISFEALRKAGGEFMKMQKQLLLILISLTMIFNIVPEFLTVTSAEEGVVTTAEELLNAFRNVESGGVITLGANIEYDQSTLGSIPVEKDVVLDFNEYKITVTDALFEITETGNLTLKKAQITTDDDVIEENKGVLTIESTFGDGIISSDDIISDNYGSVTIKSGNFDPGYSIVNYNYENASVIIEYANVDAQYIIYDLYESSSVEIKDGTYNCKYSIISSLYGNAVIQKGNYTSKCESFDGIYSGSLTVVGGTFNSNMDIFDDVEGGTLTIKGGTFTVGINSYGGAYSCIDASDNGVVNIEGGEFTATCETIYAADDAVITLSGGIFTSPTGYEAIHLCDNSAQVIIPKDYKADPENWKESEASIVKIVPRTITISYISEGVEYDSETDVPSKQVFPASPTHSGGYEFKFWETEEGERVDDPTNLIEDTTLYAVFSDITYTVTFSDKGNVTTETVEIATPLNEVPNINRTDSGDGFCGWKKDDEFIDANCTDGIYENIMLTAIYSDMITTYDELVSAIENKQDKITLGANIYVEDTIVIDYDVILDGNGFGLIRPESFQGALLTTTKGVTGGEETGDISKTDTTLTANNLLIDGKNYDAYSAAVYVGEGTTINMENVTIQNNKNYLSGRNYWDKSYYSNNNGGAFYIEKSSNVNLKKCKILNNIASNNGGGIYGDAKNYDTGDTLIQLKLDECTVQNNTAGDYGEGGGIFMAAASDINISKSLIENNTAKYGGALVFDQCGIYNGATGVNITDTIVKNNIASYGGGALATSNTDVHMYGTTSFEYNKAKNGGACITLNYGDEDNNIIYMHDSSSMSYNEATQDGGAVYLIEQTLVMEDSSCLHHNSASNNGGAVYAGDYGIHQNGGTIHDNSAGNYGGGVYNYDTASNFNSGMIYDNIASYAGDDLYSKRNWNSLYATQANRNYGDGNSESLGTVTIQKIEGYYEPETGSISVPYYGWFLDGLEDENFANRYTTIANSTLVCEDNDNLYFLGGDADSHFGGKAIWYGLVLAYDANYQGSTEYKYDSNAYLPGTEAQVKNSMFTRKGYRFIGWNTQPDGNGDEYSPDDKIEMSKSQVLYAQWEKIYSVKYEVTPDSNYGSPTDAIVPVDSQEYYYGDKVTVKTNLVTEWKTSDGTENGITGTWTFTPWDKESGFEIKEDTVIYGAWTFTPNVIPTPTPTPEVTPTIIPSPTDTPTVAPNPKTNEWDDGGPFKTDDCGNVYDRWNNKIYEVTSCNIGGYNLVRTDTH